MARAGTTWHHRSMHRLRACLLAFAILPLGGWEPLWRLDPDVVAGNRAYQDGRFDDALAAYQRADDGGVDKAGLAYDRGTALLGKAEAAGEAGAPLYAEAFDELGKATRGKDPAVKARAHYNRGNIAMQGKKLDDAIGEYKNALRADPLLESARSNLELALRQREKQRKQQQQQGGPGQPQPGQGQQPQPGQGQQPQPGQGQGQPQPGQGQNQGQNQPPQPQPGQGQGQPNSGQPGQPGPGASRPRMPPAQWPHDDTESDTPQTTPGAKLDQLEDMSRQLRRDQVKQQNNADGQPDQDW